MRILCATDLLPKSEPAIGRAGSLANQLGADLTLLHAIAPEESAPALEKNLQEAFIRAKARAEPLLWRTHRTAVVAVRVGNPARVILDTAFQSKARLLLLGPHRKRPLRDALEGTIVDKVLTTHHCPVLVVRNEAQQAYRRVLIAVDFSEASMGAVRAAESLVLTPEAAAAVVHSHQPPYQGMTPFSGVGFDPLANYAVDGLRQANEDLHDLLEYGSANRARYEILIQQQPAAAGILQATARYSPDLLVVGRGEGGRLRRALDGSVASRVLHDAECDVLVVPEGSFGASRSKRLFGTG